MKRVAITGCNGYLGKKFSEYLLRQGIQVIGFDIGNNSPLSKYKNFVFFNFTFDKKTIDFLHGFCPEIIYHFAWCGVSTIDKNEADKQFLNLGITYKVLELARQANIKKIIIPGSVSEFSMTNNPITGDEPDSPSDLYAATKVAVRKIAFYFCQKYSIGLNWLLITSVCGTDRNDANLISSTIDNLEKNEVVLTTPLKQKWDYIYVDDLMNALALIGEKGEDYSIYPIGSGEVHELSYYIGLIGEIMKKPNLIKIGAIPYKNNYIDNSVVDISKIKKIGFLPSFHFEDYIVDIIRSRTNR